MEHQEQERVHVIHHIDLLDAWINGEKIGREVSVLYKLNELINDNNYSECNKEQLQTISKRVNWKLTAKWQQCSRSRKFLMERHQNWLQKEIIIPGTVENKESECPKPGSSRGRPQVPFGEASTKTKKRRVQDLVSSKSFEELNFAAELSNPLSNDKTVSTTLSPIQVLPLYFDLDLSERKYNVLRNFINVFHKNFFPSLKSVRTLKKSLLPANIIVDEVSAQVDLQSLLNTTVDSIFKLINPESNTNCTLICKWGLDGSAGHSTYKQKFSDENTEKQTDEFIFVIALVPLKLVEICTNVELWKNPHPSSTLFCRPIRFIYTKKSADVIETHHNIINEQITKHEKYNFTREGNNFSVNYMLHFTMIDGKVANIMSKTSSSSKCFICGATPSKMNKKSALEKKPIVENYRFGLSTLHSWIRFFECVLHISYRLPIKLWQVRGEENKAIFEKRKKNIPEQFKSKLGLLVDKPKPGYGSTNDRNTARIFFSNAEISSEITGVDKTLIDNFYIILRVLSCKSKINIPEFKTLLDQTLQLYINLYSWYNMPSSVHKILVHGCDVIDSFFHIPIGILSEEALEATHKEIRKNRLKHTRKTSRSDTNLDLIKSLLLNSDPFISCSSKIIVKKSKHDLGDIKKYVLNNEASPSGPLNVLHDLDLSDIESSDESESE